MKVWGISFAPEGKMRQEAKELVGDDMCSELVPFSFSQKDGGEQQWPIYQICGKRYKAFLSQMITTTKGIVVRYVYIHKL